MSNGYAQPDKFNVTLYEVEGLQFGTHTVRLANDVDDSYVDLDWATVEVGDGHGNTPNDDIWVDDIAGNWTYDASFTTTPSPTSLQLFNKTSQCGYNYSCRRRFNMMQHINHARRKGDIHVLRECGLALWFHIAGSWSIQRRTRRQHAADVQRHAGCVSPTTDVVHGQWPTRRHTHCGAHKRRRHAPGHRLRDRLSLRCFTKS
jgi:hypothetical protein